MRVLLKEAETYVLHDYATEEELETMVFEHSTAVFGEDMILFPKQSIRTASGIGSIPDGFLLSPQDKSWCVLEIELEAHPLYRHIVPQITKFSTATRNPTTRRELAVAFHDRIVGNPVAEKRLQAKGIREIYKFIADALESKPKVIIVIDEKNKELNDVCQNLPFVSQVITFRTYARAGAGMADHIHAFESLSSPPPVVSKGSSEPLARANTKVGEQIRRTDIADLSAAGHIRPGFVMNRSYKGVDYRAIVLADGNIRVINDNSVRSSPSAAASQIAGCAINGWRWWKYTDENGQEQLIDDLRRKLREAPGRP